MSIGKKDHEGNQISLRVAETDPKFVGRGVALVDPKVMNDLDLSTGEVVEISSNRSNTHVLLWSSQHQDYGKKLILLMATHVII